MKWSLKTGKNRKWIETLIAEGRDLSVKGFDNEIPVLLEHLHQAWDAFQRVSTSRRNDSMSMGFVPVSEIKAYYELIGIGIIPKRRIDQIQVLDHTLVDHYNDKADKKTSKEPQS